MRIVFANNYYYLRGGSERVFFDEIRLLESKGHGIVPFTRQFNKNEYSKYSKFFPSPIEYENVSVLRKIPSAFKLIYSLECRNKFSELLNDVQPDLVHAHNIYGRLTTSIIDAAKKQDVPVVMTLHDYKLICPSYLMLLNGVVCEKCKDGRFFHCVVHRCHKGGFLPSIIYTCESYFNRIFKKYDWVKYFTCPSKFLLNKHAESGISLKRLVHIPNFIKLDNFQPSFNVGSYVLYAGRLSREKGILSLLKAIQDLDIQLKIVGDGPMRNEYERFVRENSLKDVIFEGYKSGDELRDLFRGAAFVVFPSEWYENAPMTVLEAFAYGKPVIGSDIGGIPEMIINGETGFLFSPGDHQDLREKIQYLLSNPSLIETLGRKARKRVEEEYNADLHYKRLMEIYNNASDKPDPKFQ